METAKLEIAEEFRLLPLAKVRESKTNPRRTFEPKSMADLVASVKEKGVVVPILVRPIEDGLFELVYGARRYRAAKLAELQSIRAFVRELSELEALEIQVIENKERVDVHPLEEAQGFRALMKAGKYTAETLAARIGSSVSHVYMRLKLLDLSEQAKDAFLKGEITAGHAEKIARLHPKDQAEALALCIRKVDIGEGDPEDWGHKERIERAQLPVRALQKWIDDEIHTDLARMPWDMKDKTLCPKAGDCASCPKRTGNSPALFPEVQKDSVCTDRICFKDKFNAWIDRRVAELYGMKRKVAVIVEEEYNWRLDAVEGRPGIKRLGEWHKLGKRKCRNAGVGIHWAGPDRGSEIEICTAASCAVHNPKPSYSSSYGGSSEKEQSPEAAEKSRLAQEEAAFKERREGSILRKLYLAALEAAPPKLTLEELRDLAIDAADADRPAEIDSIFPWLVGYGLSPKARKEILALKEPDLLKLVRGARLLAGYDEIDEDAVAKYCKAWKVPVGKIEAEARAAWKKADQVREDLRQASGKATQEVLGPILETTKKAFDELTCVRCNCTKEAGCPDGCSWAALHSGNRGLCSACVTPEQLARIKAKDKLSLAVHEAVEASKPKSKKKAKGPGRTPPPTQGEEVGRTEPGGPGPEAGGTG